MRRHFIPGSNSLSQSNIDTNNVCPCATNINTKVKNSSNSTALQNFTRVQKQVDIINYSTSGKTMYGNFNPFLGQTNYAEDISIRDQYLKPVNTTQGSTRASQSELN